MILFLCSLYALLTYIYIYIYIYILTKYCNHQEHTLSYLGGYKNNVWTKATGTNYQNENTKGEKEDKNNIKIIVETKKRKNKINTKKTKKLKLLLFDNFALTMTILPRKMFRQIFWFPKYTLYLHPELICYHWQNGSVTNCNFIEKGISYSSKVGTVNEVMNSIFNSCAKATKQFNSIYKTVFKCVITKVTESKRYSCMIILVFLYLIPVGLWQVNTLFSKSLTNRNNLFLNILRLVDLRILMSS